MKLQKAQKIAEEIKFILQADCMKIEIAGSIRRQKAEPNDIEILCIPKYDSAGKSLLDKRLKSLLTYPIPHPYFDYRLNKRGKKVFGKLNKLLVHTDSGMAVDIFSTTALNWYVSLFVRTGSKETNIRVCCRAVNRGLKLKVYGRGFQRADGSEIICHSERQIFETVGLKYLPPTERSIMKQEDKIKECVYAAGISKSNVIYEKKILDKTQDTFLDLIRVTHIFKKRLEKLDKNK